MAYELPEARSHGEELKSMALSDKDVAGREIRSATTTDHVENRKSDRDVSQHLAYTDEENEPEIHLRTWVALVAINLLLYTQVFALQGPPAVLSFIGKDLGNTAAQTWVPNSLSLVQATVGPVLSSASDTFQIRKPILVACCAVALIGSAIAPGSGNIYRLIAAQTLIGFGFAAVPISYSIPSEILPRRWRPMAQAVLNTSAGLSAISGPLLIGALTKSNAHTGWRHFYWIQFALWGAVAIGLLFAYRPPKRHTNLDHLSVWQKLSFLDLPGCGLLTLGLTLFLIGLNLGGNLFPWTNVRTLSTLVIGLATLVGFGLWEWKGTDRGILSHELFQGGRDRGRTFALCAVLIFLEAVLLFSFLIFYPVMTVSLFETDAFLQVARGQPYWIGGLFTCPIWGWISMRYRTIRAPLITGFLLWMAGTIGLATIQPGDDFRQLAFCALSGIGFGAPVILLISGTQLSTPHHLIATATAVTTSSRAVGATVFTAIYAAALHTRLTSKLPAYIAKAAAMAGLPRSSIPAFIGALVGNDPAALAAIPGVTPVIIGQGVSALRQAFADSLRVIYIIAAPFALVAMIACLFLGDMTKTMNYQVDAPIEDLHAKVPLSLKQEKEDASNA